LTENLNIEFYVPLVVLDAIKAYFKYLIVEQQERDEMVGVIDAISDEITTLFHEISSSDRELGNGI